MPLFSKLVSNTSLAPKLQLLAFIYSNFSILSKPFKVVKFLFVLTLIYLTFLKFNNSSMLSKLLLYKYKFSIEFLVTSDNWSNPSNLVTFVVLS